MSGLFSGSLDPFWPHAILLLVAVLSSSAVAIGIVLENPKWSFANVLVVGGVAIEAVCTLLLFGFDEGISRRQSVLIENAHKRAACIEQSALWRVQQLWDNEHSTPFSQTLAKFPGHTVRIEYIKGDAEVEALTSYFIKSLVAARWFFQADAVALPTAPPGIFIANVSSGPYNAGTRALSEAFQNGKIPFWPSIGFGPTIERMSVGGNTTDKSPPVETIILIGVKGPPWVFLCGNENASPE